MYTSQRALIYRKTVMAEPLADQVIDQIKHATELYHRLMLVVAPAGTGKTTAFKKVRERIGAPLVNVNLELSCLMLDLTESQRALRLPRLLMETEPRMNANRRKLERKKFAFIRVYLRLETKT